MSCPDWTTEFPGMISVCDAEGKILAMNNNESKFFEAQGGKGLIGTSLYGCHNETSAKQINAQMKTKKTRVYIAHEKGQKELVIQSPWFQDGKFAGLVEISVEIHGEIPLLVRD
jgi:transcriptional regulator with PAS, ATPase and Fis domain